MDRIPLYIVSGFLDSGKTQCIIETLKDDRFNVGEKTLIIALEDGDEKYEENFLKKANCQIVYFDSFKELSLNKMQQLDQKYKPERVMIEFNGMEDDRDMYRQGFPKRWEIAQKLTMVDSSTFKMYVSNMKQFIYNHVYNADLVVFNRVDGIDRKYLRNNLKPINPGVSILYETVNGEVTNVVDEDMFDPSKPLVISDEDFGFWYMDASDNPDKYDKCEITLRLKYIEKVKEYNDVGIFGRKAMVCCANDTTNISLTFVGVKTKELEVGNFYSLHGKIHTLEDEMGNNTCIVYVDNYQKIDNLPDEMVYFN